MGAVLALSCVRGDQGVVTRDAIKIPRLDQVTIDARVLLFAIGVTGIPLIFGLLPSALMSRSDLQNTLKEESRFFGSLRAARVICWSFPEVALAVMVLVGAGLLIRTVARLVEERPGFVSDHVVTASVQVPAARYKTYNDVDRFFSQLLSALRERSTVMSTGMTNVLPLDNGWRVAFRMPGESASPSEQLKMVQYHSVSDGYFSLSTCRS
jgi:hypothetical protein